MDNELIRMFHKLPYEKRVSFHISALELGMTIEEFLLHKAKESLLENVSPNKDQMRVI